MDKWGRNRKYREIKKTGKKCYDAVKKNNEIREEQKKMQSLKQIKRLL